MTDGLAIGEGDASASVEGGRRDGVPSGTLDGFSAGLVAPLAAGSGVLNGGGVAGCAGLSAGDIGLGSTGWHETNTAHHSVRTIALHVRNMSRMTYLAGDWLAPCMPSRVTTLLAARLKEAGLVELPQPTDDRVRAEDVASRHQQAEQ
jgi:hypothetical protein